MQSNKFVYFITVRILSFLFFFALGSTSFAGFGLKVCETALKLKEKAQSAADTTAQTIEKVGQAAAEAQQKASETIANVAVKAQDAKTNTLTKASDLKNAAEKEIHAKVQTAADTIQNFTSSTHANIVEIRSRIKERTQQETAELRSKVQARLDEADSIIKMYSPGPTLLEKELSEYLKLQKDAPKFNDYAQFLESFTQSIDNPFSIGFELHRVANKHQTTTLELAKSFINALVQTNTVDALVNQMNQWIQSETQALLSYQALTSANTIETNAVLNDLLVNNLFFSDAIPFDPSLDQSHPRLITFSFEKESMSPIIRMAYRVAHFTEDEWFALDDLSAAKLLEKYSLIPNKDVLSRVIVPTSLKPSSWGPYTTDGSSTFQVENRGSEVTHKLYEIDPVRIQNAMEETSQIFNETHSFHAHVVTELPKVYSHFKEFLIWYKYTSDYLYLRGLEEGLHNTDLTQIPTLLEDAEATDAFLGTIQNKLGLQAKTLPTSLDQIGDQNAKRNGIGLRSGSIYGKSNDAQFLKVGLELRDATRDMKTWREYIRSVAKALGTRSWEAYQKHASVTLPRIGQKDAHATEQIKQIFGEKLYKYVLESEPQVALPFFEFENHYYFNFESHELTRPSKEKTKILAQARVDYTEELKSLAQELQDYSSRNEKVEPEIVQHIVRMALTKWGRSTHISELFSGALQ